jgi:hypothetical protein
MSHYLEAACVQVNVWIPDLTKHALFGLCDDVLQAGTSHNNTAL